MVDLREGIILSVAGAVIVALVVGTAFAGRDTQIFVNSVSNGTINNNISYCNFNIIQIIGTNPRDVREIDCSNNNILFDSTNASLVFQDTFNRVNSKGGGTVHVTGYSANGSITSGAYNFSGSVRLPDSGYLSITGDDSHTVIKATRDNVYEFFITGVKTTDNFFNVWRDLRLEGFPSGTNNTGLYFNGINHGYHDSLFFNLFIENFGKDDVFISSANSWNMQFTNDVFELAGNYCIEHTGGSDTRIVSSKFLFCTTKSTVSYAVQFAGGFNTISSSWFYQNSRSGILLGNQPNVIVNNKFFDNGLAGSNTYFDIALSSATNTVINSNTFSASDQTNKTKCAIDIGDSASINNNIQTNNFTPNAGSGYGTAPICGFHSSGVNQINNNIGWNPRGKTTSFIDNSGLFFVSQSGTSGTVVNGTVYTVSDSPIFITSSGGTGVTISLQDNNGNIIQSGLTTLTEQYVPVGYKVKIGFLTVPTVTVYYQ